MMRLFNYMMVARHAINNLANSSACIGWLFQGILLPMFPKRRRKYDYGFKKTGIF